MMLSGKVLSYQLVGEAWPGDVVAFIDGFEPGVCYGVASGGMIEFNKG